MDGCNPGLASYNFQSKPGDKVVISGPYGSSISKKRGKRNALILVLELEGPQCVLILPFINS